MRSTSRRSPRDCLIVAVRKGCIKVAVADLLLKFGTPSLAGTPLLLATTGTEGQTTVSVDLPAPLYTCEVEY